MIKPSFQSWHCAGQRVFLRADLNIPLAHGTMLSDRRLQAIQPTLDALLRQGTQVILATHIGRPTTYDPQLSTKQLIPWFTQRGYVLQFTESSAAITAMPFAANTIILLENLRFFPGEKQRSIAFAKELAQTAPWYVNDAFGALHRDDTSLTLLADCYTPSHRSIGFLIEKELNILNHLMQDPAYPVCFILGGSKVADKLPLIEHLCSWVTTIVVCPALVFTFLKAHNIPVGISLIDHDALEKIPSLLRKIKKTKTTLMFPLDYQIARTNEQGPLSYVDAHNIPADGLGVSIGPKTIARIQEIISTSGTIFYNGMIGFSERKETLHGVQAIIRAMSESAATTIVAGGDSIAIVDQQGLTGITHCITGGGSTLTYLSHQLLPGLQPFLKNRTKTN